jgi:ATP-dependent DNA helicase DinG
MAAPPEGAAQECARGDMAELAACDMTAFFGPAGPLADLLEGYEPRQSQVEMAQAIQEALLARKHALVEAPTGTGKSIAYLAPAILSGRKVVVATANKSLQTQLFTKDIPFLRQALGREIDAVLVKGRSNYLCSLKWDAEQEEQALFARMDREHDAIPVIRQWLKQTETGDVDELPMVLDGDLRPRVVSFPDDCLQRECHHFFDNCWVNFMRDHAAEADVIITNHHLLLNALELGMGGERILPPASIYIVDEAHGLEQTATAVYETMITDYTVEQLLARTVLKQHLADDELSELSFMNAEAFQEVQVRSQDNSFVLEGELEGLRKLGRALGALADKLKRELPPQDPNAPPPSTADEVAAARARRSVELTIEALNSAATKMATVATAKHDDVMVRYAVRAFDRRRVSLELHAAPIDPANLLAKYLFDADASSAGFERMVVCTSATLSTAGSFAHMRARCGIHGPTVERILPPVFDYPTQAVLYQPALPAYQYGNPNAFYSAVVQEVERLLEVSRGRSLCLFTNWNGLQQVAQRLRGAGETAKDDTGSTGSARAEMGLVWPVRAQGDAPRDALLTWFRETPHSVLLATRSFWEGVDIPGDDLSLVVLDKMPFPTPGDPLHAARMRALDSVREGASFGQYMLPLMTLSLKQGFGRLVRRSSDRGVVAILDERLSSKQYGRQARNDLPPARFSRDFKEVHRFFQQALVSTAEYAINVRAAPGEQAQTMLWRWAIVRLSDGRRDGTTGLLTDCADPLAGELHAAEAALAELRTRVEKGKRAPGDFAVEVRCSPAAAVALAEPAFAHASKSRLRALLGLWQRVDFVEVVP